MGERILVAEGDSWFHYPSPFSGDILWWLRQDYKYDIYSAAYFGHDLKDMVSGFEEVCDCDEDCFCECGDCGIEQILEEITEPLAILLSGGGNDLTGKKLEDLLNHSDSPATTVLNESKVSAAIDGELRSLYEELIEKINTTCKAEFDKVIPILVHGYDFVVPDGRKWCGRGPWLKPAFTDKGYPIKNGEGFLKQNTEEMANLLRRFNKMLDGLQDSFGNVHHVNLLGTLSGGKVPEVAGKKYKKFWHDELHPRASKINPQSKIEASMKLLAAKFQDVLVQL